jgi:hypothetical protein
MTTSNSYDYNNTAIQIIHRGLRICGVLGSGETPSADDYDVAKIALNQMIKNWQVKNVGLWLEKQVYVFLADDQQSYLIGPTGDHATTAKVSTTLAADAAAGAGTITVTSDDGISNADYIGVELDDGTMQWTTVNGAPAADVITLTAVLTGAAASGNAVHTYTTKTRRPLNIKNARIYVGGDEFDIKPYAKHEYYKLPSKASSGQVTQYSYDPQTTNGRLYIWPTTDSVANYLILTALIPVQDFDSVNDDPDFPQEWLKPLSVCLADNLALEFDVPAEKAQRLKLEATQVFNETWSSDIENVSTQFFPR